jgi:hypothetical protein
MQPKQEKDMEEKRQAYKQLLQHQEFPMAFNPLHQADMIHVVVE